MLYTVMKDGAALKELKTLAAAKKLAEAEGAQVLCEGKVVYTAATTGLGEETAASIAKRSRPQRKLVRKPWRTASRTS